MIYIFPRWVCLFCWRKYADRSWDYINRSQTHECGNWAEAAVFPEKEYISGTILDFKWVLLDSLFRVYAKQLFDAILHSLHYIKLGA
jgi:hypothetical protein